jgi:plastocyanin
MLLELASNPSRLDKKVLIRLIWVMPIMLSQTACTTFIPGVDRVLFRNSSAQVGPLVDTQAQYPSETNVEGTSEEIVASHDAPISKAPSPEPVADPVVEEKLAPATSATKASSSPVTPKPHAVPANPSLPQPEPEEIAIDYGSVAGKVVLTGDEGQVLPSSGTMITLTPKAIAQSEVDRRPQVHIIDMEDKTYRPRYSTIHAGDQVVFVNKDNIRHNVFSSSGGNAFDLGTYGAGLKRAVTLKEPGIVKIYCNIHSEMATFVAVGDQGLSMKVDDQGRYRIRDVLPGTYEMSVWNIRGETKREITVRANKTTELLDRIDTTAFKVEPHKNKFGGKYSKNATLFEDEFY